MASTPTAASSPCPGFSPALAPTLARVAATDDFSAGRFRNRLSALPATALLDIAALACEGSAAARKRAEELIALHNPTPVWAVSNILLSPDLLGKMMATLNLSDCAAATVCKTWACTWREMVRARRVLRAADAPSGILGDAHALDLQAGIEGLAALPDGDRFCIVTPRGACQMRIVSKTLKTLQQLPGEGSGLPADLDMWEACIAAGDCGIYLLGRREGHVVDMTLYRLDLESYEVVATTKLETTAYELSKGGCGQLCLSADGGRPRLFMSGAARRDGDKGLPDEALLVLDATTLEMLSAHDGPQLARGPCSALERYGCKHTPDGRFAFYLGCLAASGDELFVTSGIVAASSSTIPTRWSPVA